MRGIMNRVMVLIQKSPSGHGLQIAEAAGANDPAAQGIQAVPFDACPLVQGKHVAAPSNEM